MKNISLTHKESAGLSQKDIEHIEKKLAPEIQTMHDAVGTGYETDYASINLSSDKEQLKIIDEIIAEKTLFKPTILVVIGIGGSNLGTFALHQALQGRFYNEYNPPLKVYFVDTVDTEYIHDIIQLVKVELNKGQAIIINVVTKSGKTTETIANFEIFLSLLIHYYPGNHHPYVVVTTDKDSPLWDIAIEQRFTLLEIPKKVGGRFSVFSSVGLFPLRILGVDCDQLLDGAQSVIKTSTTKDITKNYAALTAGLLYAYYQKGFTIHDLFVFSVELEGIGKWYRQLMGESIGKEVNTKDEIVNAGISPTVSVGTVDLHSVAQLYLAGPYDKFSTFISVENNKHEVKIPQVPEYEQLVAKIQGKTLSSVMNAILQGVQTAYQKNNRPFVSISLPEINPYYLGQLMQMQMIQMMYMGYLLDINPFDQPQVELYKSETRRILAYE